ncbi:cobalamin biosynthesis protein CobW [Alphaproteobacteria bacterium]|nr:cobalamin biosynthesis protein CobW [Alphaproteobacteria bacterium]
MASGFTIADQLEFIEMNTRIPATVITGFLGSGKTTLIRHIISHAAGKRLALIVNEFGDIGMDAAMLGDCAAEGCQIDDIIELANGCICCTVADDFLPSMQKLLEQRPLPDHIIIETSGLALPQPLVQAFNWPDIRAQVMLDGVITLVDGPALASGSVAHNMAALEAQRAADEELDHDSPIDELFKDQIGAANMIVLSKADQLDAAGEARACAVIESHLTGPTPIIVAANGVAPMDAILGLDMEEQAHERASHSHHHDHHHHDDHHHHHDHGHDAFSSFIIAMPKITSVTAAELQIATLAGEFGILRAKGRLSVDGKALPLVVQAVGQRVDSYFARWGDGAIDQLVVIGLAGLDGMAIAKRLDGQLLGDQVTDNGLAGHASS